MKTLAIKNIGILVTGDINNTILKVNTIIIEDGKIKRIGDFTPRQNTIGFINSSMHGGVATMISAGENSLKALEAGDLPGISMVVIDGQVMFTKNRNTPPANNKPAIC